MKKILFITLISLLLISCQSEAQTKDNQTHSKNTVHIVSESLSKEEETLKIVWDIETVLQDIYKMKAPVTDLEEKKHLKLSDATRRRIIQMYLSSEFNPLI